MRFRLGYNRTHGAVAELCERALSARQMAAVADKEGGALRAAALRGKATAYMEAVHVVEALDRDRRLPRRRFQPPALPHPSTDPDG